ncbi:uncharacterized protein LOC128242991 [Mya arenaria]|uniref:uncharacterized protein LOC128242991 n=1 Tax=Mya arenaria TaxID=6604 RepID=UPI0022E4FAC4|nr:uncharacterized protein LOC128242991 [Mya arenaria]
MRLTAIKKIAPFNKAHLEQRRGTAQEAKDYTSKDDETTWVERGYMTEQGVGQLKNLTDMALKGHDAEDLYEQDGGCYVSHKRKIDEAVGAIKQCQEKKRLKTAMSEGNVQLKTWQDWAVHHLDCQNDRKVLWIEDQAGDTGKTFLAKWLVANRDAICFQAGKKADIFYMYHGEKYIVFDLTRSVGEEFVPYHVMEAFKNSMWNNTKYESASYVMVESPKLLVLSNSLPCLKKMSRDRWDIHRLERSNSIADDNVIWRDFDGNGPCPCNKCSEWTERCHCNQ